MWKNPPLQQGSSRHMTRLSKRNSHSWGDLKTHQVGLEISPSIENSQSRDSETKPTSEIRRYCPRALLPRSKKNFFCSARITRAVPIAPPDTLVDEPTFGEPTSGGPPPLAVAGGEEVLGINPAPTLSAKLTMWSGGPVPCCTRKGQHKHSIKNKQLTTLSRHIKLEVYFHLYQIILPSIIPANSLTTKKTRHVKL